MSTLRRSTTGCSICKARRKKCDETKPQCLRCLAKGMPCAYDYVEYSESDKHRIQRTKPALRNRSELSARKSGNSSAALLKTDPQFSLIASVTRDPAVLADSLPPEPWDDINCSEYAPSSFSVTLQTSNILSFYPPDLSLPSAGISQLYNIIPGPTCSQSSAGVFDPPDGSDPDDDPEGIRLIICPAPIMDKNVRENSLPFVLQCYSQWAIARVFEPQKIAHTIREQIITQFSSENTRMRTILIANVMAVFAKNLVIDDARKLILNYLAFEVQENSRYFLSAPPSSPASDRQNAMCALDNMLEIFSLQISTQPIFDCVQMLECAAPVFRRACLEPPGQPLNLPNILLDPNLNLRHFATLDVIANVTTGLPALIQYEVPFSLELCEQIYQEQGHSGLQWLYGSPDQFILLLAWISSLRETPGANQNSKLISWIEEIIPQIEVATDESGDPLLRIGRMMVQECWRFAVLVYLYMGLCNADACDPRVIRAQKGVMRLVRGLKPARNPDAYVYIPLMIVGIATFEERDCDTLRARILGVRECAEPGTTGNNAVLTLEDIWTRTRAEGRAATWSDLRIATLRVTGK